MANFTYADYEIGLEHQSLDEADFTLDNVQPLYTGDDISGFLKITNPQEIRDLHNYRVIGYDPEQQRGWRIKYKNGQEEGRNYRIKLSKVKEIAQSIAENREYNRFRIVNCRKDHVQLYFEPYDSKQQNGLGRLYVFRTTPDTTFEEMLTIPDSAHRQKGDIYFVDNIVGKGKFSPEHSGFTPDTYDLILHITLTDESGEGEAHYEHNELITKSTATRRTYLEAGQRDLFNWIGHELIRRNSATAELIEVYESSISKNSLKIITFNTLTKGIQEGWKDLIHEGNKEEIARQIDLILQLSREVIPEWGLLPFTQRKEERENCLYSQAVVLRPMLRIFGNWYRQGIAENCSNNWERWLPQIKKLSRQSKYIYKYESGSQWEGFFLSRQNPLFYTQEGGGIYQLNKQARERMAKEKENFKLDPLKDVTVQNTKGSLDFMYDQLRSLFNDV